MVPKALHVHDGVRQQIVSKVDLNPVLCWRSAVLLEQVSASKSKPNEMPPINVLPSGKLRATDMMTLLGLCLRAGADVNATSKPPQRHPASRDYPWRRPDPNQMALLTTVRQYSSTSVKGYEELLPITNYPECRNLFCITLCLGLLTLVTAGACYC